MFETFCSYCGETRQDFFHSGTKNTYCNRPQNIYQSKYKMEINTRKMFKINLISTLISYYYYILTI